MRWECAAFVAVLAEAGVAFGGVNAGPELDVGLLRDGPTNALPTPKLVRDGTGPVVALLDSRAPMASESQLFVARLDANGALASPLSLVATDVRWFLLVETPADALVLWMHSNAAADAAQVFSALVRPDGSVGDAAPVVGLAGGPSGVSCGDVACLAVIGASFSRIDLPQRTASLAFEVATQNALLPGLPVAAMSSAEIVAARTGSFEGESVLLSAVLEPDASVRRPFSRLDFAANEASNPTLRRGGSDYLLAFAEGSALAAEQVLALVTLDGDGGALDEPDRIPLDLLGGWESTWTDGGYRVLTGGREPRYLTVQAGPSVPIPVDVPLANGEHVKVAGLVTTGARLLASFGPISSFAAALDEPPRPNLARLDLEGAIEETRALGLRPSQQSLPLLAASSDELLLAYEERANEHDPIVRYTFLDRDGRELGVEGRLEGYEPSPNTPPVVEFSLAAAEGGFLMTVEDSVAFIDLDGVVTPIVLLLPSDATRRGALPVSGGGVLLVLGEHAGSCGEDCGWSDVSAQRFGLDGSPLDAAPLFGPPEERPFETRGVAAALFDGVGFVVVAVGNSMEFRRIGTGGELLDPAWVALEADGYDPVESYALATASGTTLVAWSASNRLRAARITPEGWTDGAPLELAELTAAPERMAVTHDGQRFLVVWELDGALHALSVDAAGEPSEPVVLTRPESTPHPHGLALASLGDGRAWLAYSRFDANQAALTSRIKLRALEPGPNEIGSEPSPIDAGVPDGPLLPTVSCEDDAACPPDFSCDAERLVCIPPDQPPPPKERERAGCGCRLEPANEAKNPAWPALMALLLSAALRQRRRRRRRVVAHEAASQLGTGRMRQWRAAPRRWLGRRARSPDCPPRLRV